MAEEFNPTGATTETEELRGRVARLEQQVAALQMSLLAPRAAEKVAAEPVPMPPPPSFTKAVPANVAAPKSLANPAVRQTSLESDFGGKVLSKVAVVLLLVGAAWFLKWAFDNRWIGAAGRVVIGLLSGAGIVVWSERFRKSDVPSFSYALKAVGTGVLYLSLWASFHLYHQIPGPLAFAAMLGITAWNVAMAISQESIVLAAYALLGAYLTPALLSTGGDHEIFLLSYLAAIGAGLLVLLRARPWNLLLVGALPVTAVYYVAWYVQYFGAEKAGITAALVLLLWAVFAAAPLVAKRAEGALVGVLQPLAAGAFGAATMYSLLVDSGNRPTEAWVAIAFGAAYLGLSRMRRESVAAAIHLSLSLTFLTVAIPLKATGHGITVGWLAEAIAVFWIAGMPALEARARVALQWLGCAALALGFGGALLGPDMFGAANQPFWNRDFATSVGAVIAFVAAILLVRRWPAREKEAPSSEGVAAVSLMLLNVVLLFAMHREISRWFMAEQPTMEAWRHGRDVAGFTFSAWMALQGATMMVLGFWKREALARWVGLILLGVTIVKTVTYDMRDLGPGYRVVSYLALGGLLLGVSYAYQKDWLGLHVVDEAKDGAE